jgi:Protein of unknown function (DUF1559)
MTYAAIRRARHFGWAALCLFAAAGLGCKGSSTSAPVGPETGPPPLEVSREPAAPGPESKPSGPQEKASGPETARLKLVIDPATTNPIARVQLTTLRTRNANNLKQLGLGLHIYHDSKGKMPPPAIVDKAGKPLLSWRVALLPYVEQEKLYREFKLDEPWDSEHNKKLIAKMPSTYEPPNVKLDEPGGTLYQLFVGPGAYRQGLSFAKVTDGLSQTIFVTEAAEPVIWTKPEDMSYDPKKPLPKLGGQFGGDFYVAMMDGAVKLVPKTVSEASLRAAITPDGNDTLPPNWPIEDAPPKR